MIGGLGTTELIIILVIVLLIFGAGRLPEVFGSLGKGIREFRQAARDDEEPSPPSESKAETEAR